MTILSITSHKSKRAAGFSFGEILVTVVILAVLATVGMFYANNIRSSVVTSKLDTDVAKLNQIITLYLAEGGSLDGITAPQAILDKLKTVRTDADAKRQVSMMTGRAIDVRLAARAGSTVAGVRKAVWNATTKQFEISTAAGGNPVSDFYLEDAFLATNYPVEARTRTAMLYNNVDGWVWASGSASSSAYLSPVDVSATELTNDFDPYTVPTTTTTTGTTTSGTTTSGTTTSGTTTSTTSGSATSGTTTSGTTTSGTTTATTGTATSGTATSVAPATTLPKPINSPNGATFTVATFPTTISVNKNGAPATGSVLKYRITPAGGAAGAWINYTTPVAITPGAKFESKNVSTDAVLYNDSSVDSDTYYRLEDSFTGTHVPSWINTAGGPALKFTANNASSTNVELAHGDTRLDLGGGEYLDAGVENRLNFTRAGFNGVAANTDFSLGELTILNGTTFNDSEATSTTLKLVLSITDPVVQSGTINLNYTMSSTPNTSDRLASADTVTLANPTTSFAVNIGGVTYTLQVRIESMDVESGVVTGNTFYVYEGASARARLVGKFLSNK